MSGSSSLSEDSLMALLEISSRFTYNWLPRNAIPHAELVSHFYVDVEGFAFNTYGYFARRLDANQKDLVTRHSPAMAMTFVA